MIRVMGVDPGLASTGWGVVDADGSRQRHVDHGVIKTPAHTPIGERLKSIYLEVEQLIERFGPAEAGIESLYFARNATSAIPVAQARGVVFLAFALAHVPSFEYPPQAIKQSIVGQGRADKSQVQELVRVLLGLGTIPRPDHAADALAAALCHLAHRPLREKAARV